MEGICSSQNSRAYFGLLLQEYERLELGEMLDYLIYSHCIDKQYIAVKNYELPQFTLLQLCFHHWDFEYFIFHNSTQSFLLSMIPFSDQITQFVTLCQLPDRELFFIEIWIFVFTFVNFHKLKDFGSSLQEFLDNLRYTLKNSLNFWIGDQIEKKCSLVYVLFTSQEMLISGSLFPWSGGNFNLIPQEGKIWEEPLSVPSPAGGIDLSDQ